MTYLLMMLILCTYFMNYFNILMLNHVVLTKLMVLFILMTFTKLVVVSHFLLKLKYLYLVIIIYLYFNFWQFSTKKLKLINTFIYLLYFNEW